MTRAAGAARSFPLVCFSADAFNFYPVRCCDTRGKPESARKREENRKGVMDPWVKYRLVQSRVKALQQQTYIIFSHMTHKKASLYCWLHKTENPSLVCRWWCLLMVIDFFQGKLHENYKSHHSVSVSMNGVEIISQVEVDVHTSCCEQFSLELLSSGVPVGPF